MQTVRVLQLCGTEQGLNVMASARANVFAVRCGVRAYVLPAEQTFERAGALGFLNARF